MQILQLIQETESWLYRHGFQKTTVDLGYRPHWNKLRHLAGDETEFSQCDLARSARTIYGRDIFSVSPYERSRTESNAWRALNALMEFNDSGHVARSSRNTKLRGKPLTPESFNILTKYKGYLLEAGHTEATVRNNTQVIHRFLADCPIKTITREAVLDYINGFGRYRKLTAATYRSSLQCFLEFCWDNGFLSINAAECFLPYKKREGTEIATVYTPEELSILLRHVRTHGKTPVRNYAMILLIAVFGFRARDIAGLTLNAIDWEKGTIRIVQSKTQYALEHKLTDLTANALADYLLNERPESDDTHVFLKQDGTRLSDRSVPPIVAYGFSGCGIKLNSRKHGSHSIRHSLASNMLAADIDIVTISKVLGHSSVDSAKQYAKVDIPHFRLVGQEVPDHE